jgi:hypothetical protein
LDVIPNANFEISKITVNNIVALNVNHNKTISCWVFLFDKKKLDFMDNTKKKVTKWRRYPKKKKVGLGMT